MYYYKTSYNDKVALVGCSRELSSENLTPISEEEYQVLHNQKVQERLAKSKKKGK